jgi:hypothetical protein|tara:strand:- start:372 stop:473 length:102 start_codon:yes stop_codon:yes gene_type:complete
MILSRSSRGKKGEIFASKKRTKTATKKGEISTN